MQEKDFTENKNRKVMTRVIINNNYIYRLHILSVSMTCVSQTAFHGNFKSGSILPGNGDDS